MDQDERAIGRRGHARAPSPPGLRRRGAGCRVDPLGHPHVVARVVAERGVDAVEALHRLLDDLDALRHEVVEASRGRSSTSRNSAPTMPFATRVSICSALSRVHERRARRARAGSAARAGRAATTVSQRMPPRSMSSVTVKPRVCGVEVERAVLVEHADGDDGDLHGARRYPAPAPLRFSIPAVSGRVHCAAQQPGMCGGKPASGRAVGRRGHPGDAAEGELNEPRLWKPTSRQMSVTLRSVLRRSSWARSTRRVRT